MKKEYTCKNLDLEHMQIAINLAKTAYKLGEVPVGAIVVKVISRAYNIKESRQNALFHAELLAINEACKKLGNWRLEGCSLYVTLEPCPMCYGAIINARIERIILEAFDPKAGCHGSLVNLPSYGFNHSPNILGGIMECECTNLLIAFFKKLRQKNNVKND